MFALKIMRADGECEDSQKIEMNMLRKIRNKNPAHIGYNNICHIIETFHHSDFNGDRNFFTQIQNLELELGFGVKLC